ncbi:hypothetical protein ACH4SK_26615 [Streptomyces inhibens]|uniref:hypothetical protein n=1 Tax=Streptomyces inhibens TaxID=2293571 RepID=UPI00378789F2
MDQDGAGLGEQRAVQGARGAARGVGEGEAGGEQRGAGRARVAGRSRFGGAGGVVLIFARLYVVAALLTLCLKLPDEPAQAAPPAAPPVEPATVRA